MTASAPIALVSIFALVWVLTMNHIAEFPDSLRLAGVHPHPAPRMLLAGISRPMSAVAAEVRIDNLSYFHRLFRQQYGTTLRSDPARQARGTAIAM